MASNTTNITASAFPEPEKVIPALVLIIGIASVIFNGALLIVMTFNSRQIFASLGSYFIYNLAIADFVTGVNSIVWAAQGLWPTFSLKARIALLSIFWITVQVSFFTIFVMSTERLVAIVFPFKASLLMSKKKTIIYCIAVWIIAVFCAIIINYKTQEVQFVLTIVFELCIVCIVLEYVQVFRQLRVLWQSSKTRAVYSGPQNNNETKSKKTTDLQREYEVTIVVVTLAVVLVVTVFPYMIATQVVLGFTLFGTPLDREHSMELFVYYYFPIELLNFVVNPIVYAWRLPKYRKALLATFGFGKERNGLNCNSNVTTRTTCATDKEIVLLN